MQYRHIIYLLFMHIDAMCGEQWSMVLAEWASPQNRPKYQNKTE